MSEVVGSLIAHLQVRDPGKSYQRAIQHATQAMEGLRIWIDELVPWFAPYDRRFRRAQARSRRNQPGPWGQKLPYYTTGGTTNRKRNKHGRTGVAR